MHFSFSVLHDSCACDVHFQKFFHLLCLLQLQLNVNTCSNVCVCVCGGGGDMFMMLS
jgi:hypothetical protein